jgi:sugar phosphate isomerase/epimerase
MNSIHQMSGLSDEAGASIAVQIEIHKALGWSRLELRSVNGQAIATLPASQCDALCQHILAADFQVPVLASRIGNWQSSIGESIDKDLHELDALIMWAQALGSRYIRVMSYLNDGRTEKEWRDLVFDRLRTLARRADRNGLTLIHENCAGWGGRDIERQLAMLDGVGEDNFKLLFDMGNGLSYGYSALEMLERSLPHIVHVHLKDGVRNLLDGMVTYTFPGEGEAEVENCLRVLANSGYSGLYSIEPHLNMIPHLQSYSSIGLEIQKNYMRYARQAEAMVARIGEASHVV